MKIHTKYGQSETSMISDRKLHKDENLHTTKMAALANTSWSLSSFRVAKMEFVVAICTQTLTRTHTQPRTTFFFLQSNTVASLCSYYMHTLLTYQPCGKARIFHGRVRFLHGGKTRSKTPACQLSNLFWFTPPAQGMWNQNVPRTNYSHAQTPNDDSL